MKIFENDGKLKILCNGISPKKYKYNRAKEKFETFIIIDKQPQSMDPTSEIEEAEGQLL